jgi:fibronectin type 3 domain-containing protein
LAGFTILQRMTSGAGPKQMKTKTFRALFALCVLCFVGFVCCRKAPPHSVTLTWKAPVAAPGVSIVGYNLYRNTLGGEQFVKIASRISGPPYEDRMVINGRTYVYVVTALDESGRESRFSTEVRATIPE